MTQGKDATTTANGRGYSRNHNREPSRQTQPLIYPSLTAAELDDERYSSDPIIPGILEGRQHAIGGGPQKVLKTLTLACDLGLSVATGGNFLGHFKVPRPVRTAIMSGESGLPVLQKDLRRVARAAGVELRSVENLLISERLPKFGHLDHVDAMARFIEDNGLELCIIDPAYMCFDGADAGNVFIMGGMLRSIAEVFVAHKATMLLLHHSTKPAGLDGQPIELTDLSFAGFREFAAQWLLLSRRRRYIPGSGHHELWLSVGGRAGHSGLWGLDVDEGEFQVGGERKWEVRVLPHGDVHREEESQRESAKAETRAARATARIDADKRCIIKALAKIPSGDVVPVEVSKPNRKTPYQAYKLAESTNP